MSYFELFQSVFGNFLTHEQTLPLTIGQYDLWLEQELYPNDFSNNFHFVAKIHKEINLNIFEKSIQKLGERHEIIRTAFPLCNGIPIRKILPAAEIRLQIESCSDLSEDSLKLQIQKNFEKPFNLSQETPYKFFLYERSPSEYYFQIIAHHIALNLNGYECIPIELANLYISALNDKTQNLQIDRATTYSNYVLKHYERIQSDRIQADKEYWLHYLSGDLPNPILPIDSQKSGNSNFATKIYQYDLDDSLTAKIKNSYNENFFSVMTAAFQALLFRYTKEEEIIIGIPTDERKDIENKKNFKDLIGYTTNTLPLRSKVSSKQKFSQLLKDVSKDIRNMSKHRLYPMSMIMDNLRAKKGSKLSDIFKILVVSQKAENCKELLSFGAGKKGVIIDLDELKYESVGLGSLPLGRFDLALAIIETSNGYVASFHYNASIFHEDEIKRLAHNYLKLLESVANDPNKKIGELSLVSEEEEILQLNVWNDTVTDFEGKGDFINWFEKIANTTPKAIAVVFGEKEIDYGTLNHRGNQVSSYLQKQGATTNTLIGIGLERSIDLIVALLGVMKTGSAYLPFDPEHPKERIQFMLEDSNAEILITQQSLKNIFEDFQGKTINLDKEWSNISQENGCNFTKNLNQNRLAYVLYTSGSTGKPKGVEILQKSLNNFLSAMQQQLHLSPKDKWLALTTISFDISNLEILLPLSQGAAIVLADRDTSRDPSLLTQIIDKEEITHIQATPSTWQMLVDFGWKGNSKLTILSGGEALSQTLADKLVKCSSVLWNMYGPTETTIWSSMKKIDQPQDKITIGRPIANTTFYILDENHHLLPLGVPGELFIGGIGLAKGYRNRSELTEEKFIPSPFANSLSPKLYRTGDLACYLPNGEIECLGRIDHQVKIHGYRIELGEIEETLKKCSGVQQVVTVAREDKPGEKRIVAYYTGTANEREIKQTLSHYLPNYMLPSAYVHIDELPLTPNGKVNRKALPEPQFILNEIDCVAPRNTVETEIAKIFKDLLQIEKICVESHFFSLGGHSLLAAQAITKINQLFHINLPLKILFEKPSVALLAQEVAQSLTGKYEPPAILKTAKKNSSVLSYSQQRFWFLEQQTQNSAAYSVPFVIELAGDLDISALQLAVDTIVSRHDILRMIFKEGMEDTEQHVLSKIDTTIQCVDLRIHGHSEEEAKKLIESEAKKPFDLIHGPLFRFLLLQLPKQKNCFFLNFHHIVFDGFSMNVFCKELKELYEASRLGKPNPLPDLKIQYIDYVDWQSSKSEESAERSHVSWWIEKLSDAPQILDLPIDKQRPPIHTYNGASIEFLVDYNDAISLKQLAQKHESTMFMILLSVFHVFLSRYTGQNDMIIGTPVSGRTHASLDPLIGCFINTLALRTVSNGENCFIDVFERIKQESLEAFKHQDVPFEWIIENLKIERSLNYTPLFQVMFNMLSEISINEMHDLQVNIRNVDRGMSHFDLSLSMQETPQGLIGIFEYNTDLFYKETIEQMIGHFQKLVKEILKNPREPIGRLQLLWDFEIDKQGIEWNRQPILYPMDKTILQLIEEWAAKTPDALAVVCGEKTYSYHQLNDEANRIAHTLLAKGIQAEDKIVVCLERSAEFIPVILGILKAGGAYVPIDPTQPKERINVILQDLRPFSIITHSKLKKYFVDYDTIYIDLLTCSKTCNPNVSIPKNQLAYIIYTSGSTGKPKGVEIEYNGINDRVLWKNAAYPLSQSDVMLHTYSFIFDGAIINYFWPLCVGASLIISTATEQFDSAALIQLTQKYNVTTVDLLPSLLHGLLEEKDIISCQSLKTVFSGGEALPSEVIQSFHQKCPFAKLYNTYGPTEATVEVSAWECSSECVGPIAPIGKPIAGAKLYILDKDQNIVPIGVPGELHIGGIGLARGYLNDSALTDEKFIPNLFSKNANDRLYRTGDLVKYRQDGNIEFLGRIDNQVKIRGFRIDLREIESVLLHMDPVDKAIVMVKGSALHKSLVAYVILSPPMEEDSFFTLMKHYLGERLPAYMIPQQIVILKAFPTLPNGKINYKALPTPSLKKSAFQVRSCKNDTEHQLLAIWKEILGSNHITVIDNFFEMGGNSLLAMRLIAKIRNKMDLSIPLVQLFQHPTVEALSEFIYENKLDQPWSPLVLMQPKGRKKPFFCVHPVGGSVLCYSALAKNWVADRPFYALQARGLEEGQKPYDSIEMMAKEYIRAILKAQPLGPYTIGGWSFGGLVATEITRQLTQMGEKVSLLVLIDTTANIEKFQQLDIEDESLLLSELTNHLVAKPQAKKSRLSFKEQFARFIENGGKKALKKGQKSTTDQLIDLAKANYRALQKFSIPKLDVNVALIRTKDNPDKTEDLGWNKYTSRLKIYEGPGDHWTITQNDQIHHYIKIIKNCFKTSREKKLLK